MLILVQFVDYQSRTEFWLKPCCLRRHDVARISYVHDLLHRNRVEGKCCTHLTTVNATLQFTESTQTTNEVDAL